MLATDGTPLISDRVEIAGVDPFDFVGVVPVLPLAVVVVEPLFALLFVIASVCACLVLPFFALVALLAWTDAVFA